MAYAINQEQIIQEVTTAAESHPQLKDAENKENLLITLCNWYDEYDTIDPSEDLVRWTLLSRAVYEKLDASVEYSIEDNAHVFLDENVALVRDIDQVGKNLGFTYQLEATPVIVNKTPHPINVVAADGTAVHTFPKCEPGDLIRLAVSTSASESIGSIPTSVTVFGEPTGLPEQKDGVFYIVSQLVKNALPSRLDLLVPADMLRDENGSIIGCQSLGR